MAFRLPIEEDAAVTSERAFALEILQWWFRVLENQAEVTGSAHPWPPLSAHYEDHLRQAMGCAYEALEREQEAAERDRARIPERPRVRITEERPALPALNGRKPR